jgi:hypothetical protein
MHRRRPANLPRTFTSTATVSSAAKKREPRGAEGSLTKGAIRHDADGARIVDRCLEESIAYAKQREQWGKPIATFQLMQERSRAHLSRVDHDDDAPSPAGPKQR